MFEKLATNVTVNNLTVGFNINLENLDFLDF